MKLHYRVLGEGRPLMILHGLFGFSDNWQTHGKKLAEYFKVYLVDLRNHGHSDWNDEMSYQLMADDVYELCQELDIEELHLIGHSMGGKVAMQFAIDHEDLLEKLVVVDIGMKAYPMHHEHILAGIHTVDLPSIKARREAEQKMSAHIENNGIKQFLLKNLYWKEKGQLAWRMNVPILEKKMAEILGSVKVDEVSTPTLFIRGALSNYILDDDFASIEEHFIDVDIKTIENAGHWVHAEAPEEFIDVLLSFCLR